MAHPQTGNDALAAKARFQLLSFKMIHLFDPSVCRSCLPADIYSPNFQPDFERKFAI
jgi:hypothetical protein